MSQFTNLVNFRDLGGIITNEGKKVKAKRLLRSAQLFELGAKEQQMLVDDYNLVEIVDLRTTQEVESKPDDKLNDVKYDHLNIMKNSTVSTSQKDLESLMNAKDTTLVMQGIYQNIIVDEYAQSQYRKFIEILLNTKQGSTIFHCSAGKDRTGIAAAIILTILGVDKDLIMQDYLKSSTQRKEANLALVKRLKDKGLNEQQVNNITNLMDVKQEFLESAYQIAEEKYGSFEGYIKDALLVDENIIAQLKAMYTE